MLRMNCAFMLRIPFLHDEQFLSHSPFSFTHCHCVFPPCLSLLRFDFIFLLFFTALDISRHLIITVYLHYIIYIIYLRLSASVYIQTTYTHILSFCLLLLLLLLLLLFWHHLVVRSSDQFSCLFLTPYVCRCICLCFVHFTHIHRFGWFNFSLRIFFWNWILKKKYKNS